MATFNGADIFGIVYDMPTADNPRDKQVNAFNGVDGLEILDGGYRGRVTTVTGCLFGDGDGGLASAKEFFRSYVDGNAYVLVDMDGTFWSPVRLERFVPTGRKRRGADGTCWQDYSAEFLHL